MNTCVSDDYHIVNIQGIRYVSWGETQSITWQNPGKPWYVTVTYKGNHSSFYYKTETEVRTFFNKIREAMDKSKKEFSNDAGRT